MFGTCCGRTAATPATVMKNKQNQIKSNNISYLLEQACLVSFHIASPQKAYRKLQLVKCKFTVIVH